MAMQRQTAKQYDCEDHGPSGGLARYMPDFQQVILHRAMQSKPAHAQLEPEPDLLMVLERNYSYRTTRWNAASSL